MLPPEVLRAVSARLTAAHAATPPPRAASELVLMVVHPWRLHAYWRLPARQLPARRGGGRAPRLLLRLYDLTPPPAPPAATPWFDIPVSGRSHQEYVDLWADGRRYRAELGLRLPGGGFRPLVRSTPVDLPRAGEAPAPFELALATAAVTPTAGGAVVGTPLRGVRSSESERPASDGGRLGEASLPTTGLTPSPGSTASSFLGAPSPSSASSSFLARGPAGRRRGAGKVAR